MSTYRRSVITNKGLDLIGKGTLTSIVFTKIATGNGDYEEDEDLSSRTALKTQKQEFLISSYKPINTTRVKLRTVISNEGLDEGYYINEIGIYANDPDEGEILYAITVADGNGDYISEFVENVYTITLDQYINVSNSCIVSINNTGAYASTEDFEELRLQVEDTKDSIVTFSEAENFTDIQSGDNHATLFGKIKAFFKNGVFANTLKVGSYNEVGTDYCLAQGTGNKATGDYSRANGWQAEATALASSADNKAKATGQFSHASNTSVASGNYSHAINSATASGACSFATNYSTAGYDYQSTTGKYNNNKEDNLFEIGNGESESNVSNALEVKNDGTTSAQGDIVANKDSTNPISLTELNSLLAALNTAHNGLCKSIYPDLVIADCDAAEFGKLYTITPDTLHSPNTSNKNGVMIQLGMSGPYNSGSVWKFQLAFMASGHICHRFNINDTGFTGWSAILTTTIDNL